MRPFRPFGDDKGTMQYYQVPEDVLEDPAPPRERRINLRAGNYATGSSRARRLFLIITRAPPLSDPYSARSG